MSDTNLAADAAPSVPASNTPAEAPVAPAASPEGASQAEPQATQEGNGSEDQDKPKRRASERISELYGRTKAAERERDAALAELQRLRQPPASQTPFDQLSYDEQQREIVRQAVREERAAEIEQEARRRSAEAETLRGLQLEERVAAAAKAIPDLIEKIADPELPISETAALVIAESEKGPQMAYWLANNRAEALRISRLAPGQQLYELGKLEARINAAPAARTISKAPAPVPIVGGGSSSGGKNPEAMTFEEYKAYRTGSGR